MSVKQVILVNESLNLPRGKLAAQVAHASVASLLTAKDELQKEWVRSGMPKVILAVGTEQELIQLHEQAVAAGLSTQQIQDAGKTVVIAGTLTCVGIGPAKEAQINQLTGSLRLVI